MGHNVPWAGQRRSRSPAGMSTASAEREQERPALRGLFDSHCHLAWESCVPREFVDGAVANMVAAAKARGVRATVRSMGDRLLKSMQDSSGDALVAQMNEAGVEQSALLVPDMTFALDSFSLTIEELLIHHSRVASRHPGRFVLFAGVEPRWGSDGLALFERAVNDWGYRGVKLYPPCGFNPSDRSLYPYYEICAAKNLPVLCHIGPTSPWLSFATSHPLFLDDACRDFPSLNFILGHGSSSFVEDCVALCAFRPNVYLDLSGIHFSQSLRHSMQRLRTIFQRGINHKILFGTDFPVCQISLREIIQALDGEDGAFSELSEGDIALITRGNFQRLWSPAVTLKD